MADAGRLGPDRDARGSTGPGWVDAIAIRDGRVVAAGSLDDVDAAAGAGDAAPRPRARRGRHPGPDRRAPAPRRGRARAAPGRSSRAPRRSPELVARVRGAAARVPGDAWIEGAGWDADLLGRWPTAADLEAAAPGRRVALWAHDHHALARELARPGRGGRRRRHARPGRAASSAATPTAARPGVLHESAARLVSGLVPLPDADAVADALAPSCRELLALGVVAAHDPGGVERALGPRRARSRRTGGSPRPASWASASTRASAPSSWTPPRRRGSGAAGRWGRTRSGRLRMGWLKTFADGSLGSRSAARCSSRWTRSGASRRRRTAGIGVWLVPPDELARPGGPRGVAGDRDPDPRDRRRRGAGRARRAGADRRRDAASCRASSTRSSSPRRTSRGSPALGIAASMQPVHVRSRRGEGAPAVGRPRRGARLRARRARRDRRASSRSAPTRRSSPSTRGRGSPAP